MYVPKTLTKLVEYNNENGNKRGKKSSKKLTVPNDIVKAKIS